jgi:hypothetical protein
MFQTESEHWPETYEDTAFCWLLGTDGKPKKIDGVFQIHHVSKERYTENSKCLCMRVK